MQITFLSTLIKNSNYILVDLNITKPNPRCSYQQIAETLQGKQTEMTNKSWTTSVVLIYRNERGVIRLL